MNSASGGVGIELNVVDKNGTASYDFISFRIEKCNDKGNVDDDDNQNQREKIKIVEQTEECSIISETINIAGQLPSNRLRIAGLFDQCKLDKGSLLLNIPNDKDWKLVVATFDFDSKGQSGHGNDAIYLDMVKVQQSSDTHGLYKVSLKDPQIGRDLVTEQPKTLSNINTIVLWNSDPRHAINFGDSTIGMSIALD